MEFDIVEQAKKCKECGEDIINEDKQSYDLREFCSLECDLAANN